MKGKRPTVLHKTVRLGPMRPKSAGAGVTCNDRNEACYQRHRRNAVSSGRRRFLGSTLGSALGLAVGCTFATDTRAAPTGRVLLGFQVPASFAAMLEAILTALQKEYRPDLGSKPVFLLGGSSALSVDTALKSPLDGSTALIAPSAFLTLLPEIRKLPDDPVRRLVPVAGIGETTIALIVGPKVPASIRTIAAYFEWMRDNPMMASYAVPGLGTAMNFIGHEVMQAAGITAKAVNYRGPQPMLEDVVSGAIPAAFTVVPDEDFESRFPTIRILAVASDQRWPTCPAVPTLRELGLIQIGVTESLGFFFVEGTPTTKVDELAAAIGAVTARPEIRAMMKGIAMRPMSITDRSYARILDDERKKWIDLAKRVALTSGT